MAMLHLAELAIHRMDLDEAQNILHKANRLVGRVSREGLDSRERADMETFHFAT